MWRVCMSHKIELREAFRQKDPDLAMMLNDLRTGRPNQAAIQEFSRLSHELAFGDGIEL